MVDLTQQENFLNTINTNLNNDTIKLQHIENDIEKWYDIFNLAINYKFLLKI
jgi:hypothetical protein